MHLRWPDPTDPFGPGEEPVQASCCGKRAACLRGISGTQVSVGRYTSPRGLLSPTHHVITFPAAQARVNDPAPPGFLGGKHVRITGIAEVILSDGARIITGIFTPDHHRVLDFAPTHPKQHRSPCPIRS